ncbi:hypothetical protein Kpol_1025p26 [Vanderwaltozyma polyspora DSM 70294]|uniref:Uncharacterized protein n=1 Tax=Vanderwaltozyma polyspora (strain ATCC 22028 / DSM 70294 / BCRC 21397 / CBS 2163 / NBRC 10782 / NRRL Y-8283 / UCD 57-17) TaxID=436907 RepID=A7TKV1_VANPO|nr:uncharacterized protein Kpol_1025p26 [Vanderwaltozyma polyspora DSM 70294]EDO17106.1 hypothetical protein Kpol_1025p26 [Vanderwaltozyma polyspora DSM 70294]
MEFNDTYLKSEQLNRQQLISCWKSSVEFNSDIGPCDEGLALYLPSIEPNSLILEIDVHFNNRKLTRNEFLFQQLELSMSKGLYFWKEKLLYDCSLFIDEDNYNKLCLKLNCRIWNGNKISSLLQKPIEYKDHRKFLPKVYYLQKLEISSHFFSQTQLDSVPIVDFVNTFNEFTTSLFLSQLEFRFPLVFSSTTRQLFRCQESELGPISYALSDSPALIPILISIISNNMIYTSIYQLVNPKKKITKDYPYFKFFLL